MPQLWHVLFTEGPKSWVELGGPQKLGALTVVQNGELDSLFRQEGRGWLEELADNWHKVVEKT